MLQEIMLVDMEDKAMAMEDRATTTIMAMETIMIMVVMEEDMETTTATMTTVAGTMAKVETTVELDMVRKMCNIICHF